MQKLSKKLGGFAHHALLGVVVIAVIALAGVKVLTGIHAASPPNSVGYFAPDENTAFANKNNVEQLAVRVDKSIKVNKVEWYLNNTKPSSLQATTDRGTTISNVKSYAYNWKVTNLGAGSYHWLAKIYTPTGNSLALNNQGNRHLDALVIGAGGWAGKFAQKQHEDVSNNKPTAPIDVVTNECNYPKPPVVEWYIGNTKVASSSHPISDVVPIVNIDCGLFNNQQHHILTFRYNFPTTGITGPVTFYAKVIDSNGKARLATNNQGDYYLTIHIH